MSLRALREWPKKKGVMSVFGLLGGAVIGLALVVFLQLKSRIRNLWNRQRKRRGASAPFTVRTGPKSLWGYDCP